MLFQELKFAIEALGGEYEKERDFSNDPAYKKIMAAGRRHRYFRRKKIILTFRARALRALSVFAGNCAARRTCAGVQVFICAGI